MIISAKAVKGVELVKLAIVSKRNATLETARLEAFQTA